MMDVVPDEDWDDVLNELVRIMKKGGYIECLETYPDLFDTGPAMSTIMQRKCFIYIHSDNVISFMHARLVK